MVLHTTNIAQTLAWIALIAAPIAAVTITFQASASSDNFYSSFTLGYVSSGANFSVIVNPSTTPTANYNILLWRPNTAAPSQTAYQTAGPFVGPKGFAFNPTDVSGSWRIQVLPNGDDFIFQIKLSANNNSVGNFYGIASSGRVFAAYYGPSGNYSAQLSMNSGSLSDINFALYGPFSNLTVAGGTPTLPTTTSSLNSSINYNPTSDSFYYFVLKPKANFYTQNNFIRLVYPTDVYQCPYLTGSTDYNSNFQGCSYTAPTKGPPCIVNDVATGKCLFCTYPLTPNTDGVCTYNTSCAENQYFHYGLCQNVIDNCIIFQKMGDGTCKLCKVGYNLINYNNGSQYCDQIAQTCTDNQYLVGKICLNKVANCSNFIQLTGTCKSCSIGYSLTDNKCVPIPVSNIVQCPTGQIFVGVCKDLDPYCIFYGDDSICLKCAAGWALNGNGQSTSCKKINCGYRQYSAKGFCDDVSPFCDTFDSIYGLCTSCIPGYNLQIDGTCIQVSPGGFGGPSQPTCQSGYYLLGTTCTQVSPLCQGYDKTNGLCTSCKDTKTYYLIAGVCQNIFNFCINQPRTYFNKGKCTPISRLCNQYDSSNGDCTTCFDNTYVDPVLKKCRYNQTCNATQYKGAEGNCIAGNVNCTSFNQDTGACLSCKPGFDLNGQTCCRYESYIDTPECKSFLEQNCASPSKVSGCLACNSGFSKPLDSYGNQLFFSKCIPN